jgi:DhnA family fructose-bisphosphate aldolase class Ia
MSSKQYHLQELRNPTNGLGLIVDTSSGLTLGPLAGLENYEEAVNPVLPWTDGLVASPGQSRRLAARTRSDAALLVCSDWTNAFRGRDFVLPPEKIHYLPLLNMTEARDLGASAVVMHFLLGHEETIDALCLQQVVQLALEGSAIGMPLIVHVAPLGPRVVLPSKAIELGVSYALEGGADGIVIPWPGPASFAAIMTMAGAVPVWVKIENLDPFSSDKQEMLEAGAAGYWLDAQLFAAGNTTDLVRSFHDLLHGALEV